MEDSKRSTMDIAQPVETVNAEAWTRRACVIGLAFMWFTGIGVIVYGAIAQRITDTSDDGYEPSIYHHKAIVPFLRLALSFVVTALSDVAGLIHSTSLRFTLLAARRLTFNSNLRLFTSCTANSRVHWWPVNIIWAWALISSYACGAMVLLESVYTFGSEDNLETSYNLDVVSGYSLIFLGFGLLGQASIATWALKANKFPTWSTNPMHIATVCKTQGWMTPLSRRSLRSVHDAQKIELREIPTLPKARQGSLLKAHFQIRRILIATWIVTLVTFLLFASISAAYQLRSGMGTSWGSFSRSYTNDWSFLPNWVDTTAFLAIPTSIGQTQFSFGPWLVCKYLLTCTFVAGITLNLHIIELLVQASRDESLWRKLASGRGLRPNKHGAICTAISSWQTIALFVFKCLIHWTFSLAFGLMWEGVELRIPQVLYTALLLFSLAVLATCLALYRPKGPQPATFGHLPTLIDLIDVWPCKTLSAEDKVEDGIEEKNKATASQTADQVALYWGDKGEDNEGIRRAGTAFSRLKPIVMPALYL